MPKTDVTFNPTRMAEDAAILGKMDLLKNLEGQLHHAEDQENLLPNRVRAVSEDPKALDVVDQAAIAMSDVSSTRPLSERLREVGCEPGVYPDLVRLPEFREALREKLKAYVLFPKVGKIFNALARKAEWGDLRAIDKMIQLTELMDKTTDTEMTEAFSRMSPETLLEHAAELSESINEYKDTYSLPSPPSDSDELIRPLTADEEAQRDATMIPSAIDHRSMHHNRSIHKSQEDAK